jgi:hypothetical protein
VLLVSLELAVHRVHLEPLETLELVVLPGLQVRLVHLDLLVLPDVRDLQETPGLLDLQEVQVHLELLETLALPVPLGLQVQLVHQDLLVQLVLLV